MSKRAGAGRDGARNRRRRSRPTDEKPDELPLPALERRHLLRVVVEDLAADCLELVPVRDLHHPVRVGDVAWTKKENKSKF